MRSRNRRFDTRWLRSRKLIRRPSAARSGHVGVAGIGSGWIVNWRAEPPVTFRQAVDVDETIAAAHRAFAAVA